MTILLLLFIAVPITLLATSLIALKDDRTFLRHGVLVAWTVLVPLVAIANEWMPFASGGDDYGYFQSAELSGYSLTDLLDFTRFETSFAQSGYPFILSIISYSIGHDLIAYKLANGAFLIGVALIWYRIATELESQRFGRTVFVGILLVTPLWYYVIFVLKDIAIVFIQSAFLLGLVIAWKRNSITSWLLLFTASIAVLPFRSALVIQHISILILCSALRILDERHQTRKVYVQIAMGLVVAVLIAVSTDIQVMNFFGIRNTEHLTGATAFRETSSEMMEQSVMNRALFPLIYLFSETVALNPTSWEILDDFWLRGLLALPWIFVVVPFFFAGMVYLLRPPSPPGTNQMKGIFTGLYSARAVSTPWAVVVFFVLFYIATSWVVGDTTRWRLPDMPAIATIALAGWFHASASTRRLVFLFWTAGLGSLFGIYIILARI